MHASAAFIAETCPALRRGMVICLKEAMLVGGILKGQLTSFIYIEQTDGWRKMLASAFPLAALMGLGVWFLPESPRWLLLNSWRDVIQNRVRAAAAAAGGVRGPAMARRLVPGTFRTSAGGPSLYTLTFPTQKTQKTTSAGLSEAAVAAAAHSGNGMTFPSLLSPLPPSAGPELTIVLHHEDYENYYNEGKDHHHQEEEKVAVPLHRQASFAPLTSSALFSPPPSPTLSSPTAIVSSELGVQEEGDVYEGLEKVMDEGEEEEGPQSRHMKWLR